MAREEPQIIGNYAIQREWVDEQKGLRKELASFKFQSVTKANDLSKCCVAITELNGLKDHHDTKYLRDEHRNLDFWITLSNAITAIDCYIEILLKQMLVGETSRCSIKTKTGDCISFVLRLIRVEFGGYIHSKSVQEILVIAHHHKENGVKMFKKYPLFAHQYFNKAAKLLISCQPLKTLKERESSVTEAEVTQVRELLETTLSNICMCLIKQQRYDEAVHVTDFVEGADNVADKAIYRRANALFLLGKLDDAKQTIERINYKEQKECLLLHTNISQKLKQSEQNYRKMIQNMFT